MFFLLIKTYANNIPAKINIISDKSNQNYYEIHTQFKINFKNKEVLI